MAQVLAAIEAEHAEPQVRSNEERRREIIM